MKVKSYKGEEERSILVGLITNTEVLDKISAGLKGEKRPFLSKWSNIIYGWCIAFHEKYKKAPRRSIQTVFRHFAAQQKDEATVGLIEDFLVSLNNDYRALAKDINPPYLVDCASRYFNKVRMIRFNEGIESDLLGDDLAKARERVVKFVPVDFSAAAMVDVLTDAQVWREALSTTEEPPLIVYPGALGEFFQGQLGREAFVSFLAPEKRGKSFWLIDMAWRAAVDNKRRTLFYSVGDMTQTQMMRRFITRAIRRPIQSGFVDYPKRLVVAKDGETRVRTKHLKFSQRVSRKRLKQARKDLVLKTASSRSLLRMRCTSNSTTNIADVRVDIDDCIRNGWVPDVVVVDYADILAPEPGIGAQDFRHQQNTTWKAMRRLSQDYHCLVLTATQSDAESYDRDILRKRNFSEDKRKFGHVTGMAGINQTDEEKEKGVYRLNWLVLREGVYYESRCVFTAGSLKLCNPSIRSMW